MKKITFIALMAIGLLMSCQPEDAPAAKTGCDCEITEFISTDGANWQFYRTDPRSGQITACEMNGVEQYWTNANGTVFYKNHFDCQ